MFRRIASLALFALSTVLPVAAQSQPAAPRPEHPRPDFQRSNWLNLNGSWEFQIDKEGKMPVADIKPDMPLAQKILVPFCPESRLSGIGQTDFMKHVFYRRRFALPAAMQGQRVLLTFGAVDFDATVWVNGRKLGSHQGGYTPFTFDVTAALQPGENQIFLSVYDDTASSLQATGKQAHSKESRGCVYTRTTGIWQTVYLEAVGETWIRDVSLLPDVDGSRLFVQSWIAGPGRKATVRLTASAEGRPVASEETPAAWRSTMAVLRIPAARLWQVGAPYLYDLKITLQRDGRTLDEVSSYFGMRKLSIDGNRFLINDKPVFQRTVLDQGFYPDGIYTAPTDAALRRDIELSMAAGFNGARLHQKVFEPRLLYWADKLGYLVWGEYPSWGANYGKAEVQAQVLLEWEEELRRDRNHPAIIGWCPLNETSTGAEYGQMQRLLSVTQLIDPTRPFLDASGYSHLYADTDVFDSHNYNQNPDDFRRQLLAFSLTGKSPYQNHRGKENDYAGQPYFVSEYGGAHLASAQELAKTREEAQAESAAKALRKGKSPDKGDAKNKERRTSWGYGSASENIDAFLARYKGLTDVLLDNPNCFGFCYTQLTDVEQEQNGVYYYDRRPKYDPDRLKQINARPAAYETQPPRLGEIRERVLVPTSEKEPQTWRMTLVKPAGAWFQPGYDDASWKAARGGFGTTATPGAVVGTQWKTGDIWIRREFELDRLPAAGELFLRVHHDEDAEIYLNGQDILHLARYIGNYQLFEASQKLRAALRPGKNLLAVHCHQTTGGQFIDCGIQAVEVLPQK
jgi:hypothetical protein